MQAVRLIGSCIRTVSGPFHPFGGAVDIIVVEQPDGSYKSSPWYVRFGKFQGVLKSNQKIVNISVNGAEANFHMHLDNKGEAFFLTEADEELVASPPFPSETRSCNLASSWSDSIDGERPVVGRTNSHTSLFRFVFGRRSSAEEVIQVKDNPSVELAEFTADLFDIKWSTNLDSQSTNTVKDEKTPEFVKMVGSVESVREEGISLDSKQLNTEGKDENAPVLKLADAANGVKETSADMSGTGFSLEKSIINDYMNDEGIQRTRLCSVSSDACVIDAEHVEPPRVLTRMASSLPNYIGPFNDALDEFENSGAKKNDNTRGSKVVAGMPPTGRKGNAPAPFPYKRTISRKVSDVNGTEVEIFYDLEELEDDKVNVIKQKVRTLTPTSEQLASLNLKHGKNTIIFTFFTSMLGQQQVDARIFLWRWNTRIVISDVDGTITRSDVLGQVMPLVGMDWSQTGVAHLFSAIKENGYDLIFLSARSISQSFVTRQFLLNIKQDGIALPEGPVVISPDGLFPSLFREVVRRAPHEFKIACLEDIKALFPPGSSPFYAGFGNRDTDEVSYLKVGIPMGKIFIINPRGEIAVNRSVDTKSYTSLHDLVHTMFPTMSSCEQEDYNNWNFWKLPLMNL